MSQLENTELQYQQSQYLQNSPQENINSHVNDEYRFFYKPINDFQIYDINVREISIEQLLNESIQNCIQPNNLHMFCFLNPCDKKIYKISLSNLDSIVLRIILFFDFLFYAAP